MPFFGKAFIGCIAHEHPLGLSGRAADPQLAVVTLSGEVPVAPRVPRRCPDLDHDSRGPAAAGQLPRACTIVDLGARSALRSGELLAALGALGGSTVLTEGGPRLLGVLVADNALDELFLTVSPVLAGRAETSSSGPVAAQELQPARAEQAELVSVRRRASYLFLRYQFRGKETL
jgi:riboflavin biosynthesis pyrimidine reductase